MADHQQPSRPPGHTILYVFRLHEYDNEMMRKFVFEDCEFDEKFRVFVENCCPHEIILKLKEDYKNFKDQITTCHFPIYFKGMRYVVKRSNGEKVVIQYIMDPKSSFRGKKEIITNNKRGKVFIRNLLKGSTEIDEFDTNLDEIEVFTPVSKIIFSEKNDLIGKASRPFDKYRSGFVLSNSCTCL